MHRIRRVRGTLAAAMAVAILLPANYCFALAAGVAAHSTATSWQTSPSRALLDINRATAAQLSALPGMGQAYAQRVIGGRPYTAKNQLSTRGVLPAAEYEAIKPLIVAHRLRK